MMSDKEKGLTSD